MFHAFTSISKEKVIFLSSISGKCGDRFYEPEWNILVILQANQKGCSTNHLIMFHLFHENHLPG